MRIAGTLAIAIALGLCATPGVAAQDTGTGPDVRPRRPAEFVAAQVRSVLRHGGSPDAWRGLADVLPELALAGNADVESTFQAARLAEEMSGERVAEDPARSGVGLGARPAWLDLTTLLRALAIVVGTALLWRVVRRTLGVRTRPALKPAQPTPLRFREARALVSTGVPLHEISRKTGMARDAIHVLAGLQRR